MAWGTCPYCGKRENGWSNEQNHQRGKHAAEYRLAEAKRAIGRAEEHLANTTKDKLEYEILDSFLAQALPELVKGILAGERDKRRITRWMGYDQGDVAVPFDQQIAEDTEWLAQKRAELAALQSMKETA